MAIARAKGQPRTAPSVKYTTAESVRWLSELLGGMNACDSASVVVYIANDEGRRARNKSDSERKKWWTNRDSPVDAFHMPALATNMNNM